MAKKIVDRNNIVWYNILLTKNKRGYNGNYNK